MIRDSPSPDTTDSSGSTNNESPPKRQITKCVEPPLYSIDLSSPPECRYDQICNDYKNEMAELAKIYDDLLADTPFPRLYGYLGKNLLKKVYSKEETEEIRGISKATGVPIYRVVAYNTFLDLFSGCISGGTRTKTKSGTKMLHFRNLDWEMEPLRDMVIRVEYLVKGKVVARLGLKALYFVIFSSLTFPSEP